MPVLRTTKIENENFPTDTQVHTRLTAHKSRLILNKRQHFTSTQIYEPVPRIPSELNTFTVGVTS